MAEFIIDCPHCGNVVQVQSSQSNQEIECPTCQQKFTVPQLPDVQVSAHTPYEDWEDEIVPAKNEHTPWPGWVLVKGVICFVLVCLIITGGGQIYGCAKARQQAREQKVLQDKHISDMKNLAARYFDDGDNLYSFRTKCEFVDAELTPESKDHYSGTVTFTWNGKTRQRRLEGTVRKESGESYYDVSILREYDSKPEHLLEDAGILYELVRWGGSGENILYWAGWDFVSARTVRKNVLAITVENKEKATREFLLQVTDEGYRLKWEIIDK
ncbi:MAG: hypothetical protein E7047_02970 [Lentisphaerae bacterium]|nr:hypothetical protein [Lentisphaerota bacterium]